ncbi:MAG: cytochrome P450 [Micromonosporaceae bacterium]
MTDSPRRPRIQAIELASAPDPYPAYAALRERGAVVRGEFGQWLVTRHSEISTLLRDHRLVSEFPADFIRLALGGGEAGAFLGRIVLTQDPPTHTRLRRFLGNAFGTRTIRALQAGVASLVDELLEPVRGAGRFDLVNTLALPLPVTVVCRLIGIPDADRADVTPRVLDLARVFDAANLGPGEQQRIVVALHWLRNYLADLLRQERSRPRPQTLTGMYQLDSGRAGLTTDEFIDNLLFLFHAGFETTQGLIANGIAALLDHRDQFDRVRADPTLTPAAVEEFLRFDPPIQNTVRVARERIEIAGQVIRRGRSVMLLLGAANRDERVFADPDRLDVGRTPNPHLGFGGGLHHCIGVALARLTAEVAFDRLLRGFAEIELDGTPIRRPHGSLRAFDHMPLRVT